MRTSPRRGTEPASTGRYPILVTGAPRSGTTWLARLLATAPGTVLAGREPMNPRGNQYALAHTVRGWVSLDAFDGRQRRVIRSAYRGLNPMVYSRYGRRQWAGPLPRSRMIVKDPFAMLSLGAVVDATRATAVLVYRHPGAVLASYRRMGWKPDLEELQPIVARYRNERGMEIEDLPASGDVSEAESMGCFWGALYDIALWHAARIPAVTIVSHEELATGGVASGRRLLDHLGLRWNGDAATELSQQGSARSVAKSDLHNFDRAPASVAGEWRTKLEPGEIDVIERTTQRVRANIELFRLPLTEKSI